MCCPTRIGLALCTLLLAACGDAERIPPGTYEGLSAELWAERLRSGDEETRIQASHALSKIGPGAAGATAQLALSLRDSVGSVRRNAAQALARIGPPAREAVSRLTEALRRADDTGLQQYAARALGAVGPDAAASVRDLTSTLVHSEGHLVRKEAARSLGKIAVADGPVLFALDAALSDPNMYVRRAASRALADLGRPAVPTLASALGDASAEVRFRAAEALARMEPFPTATVEAALRDASTNTWEGAARALTLAKEPPASVVPLLLPLVKSGDREVRWWGMRALARQVAHSGTAALGLMRALDDKRARTDAVLILSMTRDAQPVLLNLLEHSSARVRAGAAEALGLSNPKNADAARAIEERLQDPAAAVRRAAAVALARMRATRLWSASRLAPLAAYKRENEPYLGYDDDIRLHRVKTEGLSGPLSMHSHARAVHAALRLFRRIDFKGLSEIEVVALVGKPDRTQERPTRYTYSYDTGYSGVFPEVTFENGRVVGVRLIAGG